MVPEPETLLIQAMEMALDPQRRMNSEGLCGHIRVVARGLEMPINLQIKAQYLLLRVAQSWQFYSGTATFPVPGKVDLGASPDIAALRAYLSYRSNYESLYGYHTYGHLRVDLARYVLHKLTGSPYEETIFSAQALSEFHIRKPKNES